MKRKLNIAMIVIALWAKRTAMPEASEQILRCPCSIRYEGHLWARRSGSQGRGRQIWLAGAFDSCNRSSNARTLTLSTSAARRFCICQSRLPRLKLRSYLCEKPLANTLAEAERMLEAVRSSSCIHMLCHNYRRAPAVMLAKQLIDEGRIGKLYHYRGTYLQDWIVDPDFPRVWRLEKARAGSGALGDLVSHTADLSRFLVSEINEVAGILKTFITERPMPDSDKKAPVDVDDAAISLVKFENGALGSIEASRFALGHKNHLRVEINGSKGSVAFDLERLKS